VAYRARVSPLEEPTRCAVCRRARVPRALLDPPAGPSGGRPDDAPGILAVCEECVPNYWAPGAQVTDEDLAVLRARRAR
jgi:hypothetical protein